MLNQGAWNVSDIDGFIGRCARCGLEETNPNVFMAARFGSVLDWRAVHPGCLTDEDKLKMMPLREVLRQGFTTMSGAPCLSSTAEARRLREEICGYLERKIADVRAELLVRIQQEDSAVLNTIQTRLNEERSTFPLRVKQVLMNNVREMMR